MMTSNIESEVRERNTVNESMKDRRFRQTQKKLFVSFVLMLAFTFCSFYAIVGETIPDSFAMPFILVLAIMQVLIQLFLFMHLDDKGSGYQTVLIGGGFFFGVVCVVTLTLLIWW